MKAFLFHFSLLEFQKPTLAGPWEEAALCINDPKTLVRIMTDFEITADRLSECLMGAEMLFH